MLVTQSNFDAAIKRLEECTGPIGLDSETTGIFWWETPNVEWYVPRVFSIQFSTELGEDFYFDFNHSPDKLGAVHFEILQKRIFSNPRYYWFLHNAKFDLHQLRNHGCTLQGTVHCTKHIARVCDNTEGQVNGKIVKGGMSLDTLAHKYLGQEKLDVMTHLKENKLFTLVERAGSDPEEWMHFDRLPLELLVKYGERDTRLCLELGLWQLNRIKEMDATYFVGTTKRLSDVLANENCLTKTVFEMERVGIKIDRKYCQDAYDHEVLKYTEIKKELDATTKLECNWLSADDIKKYFAELGIASFKLTKTGAMSFDKDALEKIDHDSARKIVRYRYHYKRAHTYFGSYLWLADSDDVIHCDLQNSGADTGRMSCWNPNLQNVPKRGDKEETDFKVRRCFIPRPGNIFVDIDYSGAEFYMAMDYSREMRFIDKIKSGVDPHTFTKELFESLGVNLKSRDTAKTMTFRLIYGAGNETVGVSIGYERGSWDAKKHGKVAKELYFREFKNFSDWMGNVQRAAKQRGYVFNWLGRVLKYVNVGGFGVETWFKSPNGVIQGGIGDTLKVAMNQIAEYLFTTEEPDIRMLVPVHDAILFEAKIEALPCFETITKIMRDAYPSKVLPLEVDIGYSATSWGSLTETPPAVA